MRSPELRGRPSALCNPAGMFATMLDSLRPRLRLALLLAGVCVVGCLGAAKAFAVAPVASGTQRSAAVPSCPAKAPPSKLPPPLEQEGRLLSDGAQALSVCRYEPRRRGGLRLAGHASVSSEARIEKLTAELDALPRMPPGAFACPLDRSASILVAARFSTGQVSDVLIGLEGCRIATNGVAHRWAEPARGKRLIAQLDALTGRR